MLLTRGEILELLDERIARFDGLLTQAKSDAEWTAAYAVSESLKAFRESIHQIEKKRFGGAVDLTDTQADGIV